MDYYNRQSNYSGNAFLILSFISFAIYNYCIFNKYALGGDKYWVIIPGIMMFLMLAINVLMVKKNLSSMVLFIVMGLLSVALYTSADYIKTNDKGDKNSSVVEKLEIKYLVSIIVFIVAAIVTATPIADWIAGDTYNAMYSKTFIFIFSILCFTTFILIDTIRNYNLFDLKKPLFGDEGTDDVSNSKTFTICMLGLWMIYALIVFQGIQYIGINNGSDTRHYISIAFMTLVWVILSYIYSTKINNDCSTWTSVTNRNDYQEIYINIISFTTLLFILSITDRYRRI